MFKRIALTLTFVAALATAGLTFATPAQAWRYYGGRPYANRYYGPRTSYYAPYRSYRSYYGYRGPVVVAPRVYRPYYYNPYYAPYGPEVYYSSPGVSFSFGL
jgi:hypothetical protein